MTDLVDPSRLIELDDVFDDSFDESFPDLAYPKNRKFSTYGEAIVVTDPMYITDMDSYKNPLALYLRQYGIIASNFGRDTSGRLWWKSPYLVLNITGIKEYPSDAVELGSVGCDGAAFIFLPYIGSLPSEVRDRINILLLDKNAILLDLPAGSWQIFYEQFDPPQPGMKVFYRNIVLNWDAPE